MDTAVDPARQVPEDPRVDGPERQLDGVALDRVEDPPKLEGARVGRHRETGRGPEAIDIADPRHGVGGAGVLPDDRRMHRPTRPSIPDDGRLTLIADADGGERAGIDAGLAHRDAHPPPAALQDLVWIVLDPARPWRDLSMLELVARYDPPVVIEQQ